MENNAGTITVLRRFTIIPGHEENYLEIWAKETKLRQRYGFKVLNAFIETGLGIQFNLKAGEYQETGKAKIFTWLYSYDGQIDSAESNYSNDTEASILEAERKKHIFADESIRRVNQKIMVPATEDSVSKMVIMRRYNIMNDWNEFLDIWKRIVLVREKHGFPCLFAVEDIDERVFTWAFTYDGDDFETFMSLGQIGYYTDPQRVELEEVNNYLEEIRLTPAHQLMTS